MLYTFDFFRAAKAGSFGAWGTSKPSHANCCYFQYSDMSHVVTLPRDPQATAGRTTAQGWLDRAVHAHRAGQLLDAEHLYRQALQVEPANADALHLLGVLASQRGQQYLAAGYIQEALFRQPDQPFCHSNLGIALRRAGQAGGSRR